jgi:hypothetical protein
MLGCPFSRVREKVPEADEGTLATSRGRALIPTLSRERERGTNHILISDFQ